MVNAQKLIEWMQEENDITSREEGVALGREFIATGILRHGKECVVGVQISITHDLFIHLYIGREST